MKAALLSALIAFGLPLPGIAATAPAPKIVHVHDYAFVPKTLTIAAGTTVRFINDDDEPHTVTAFDKSFDSKGLDTNEKYDHTFTTPGTFRYFCTLHPMMRGAIVVTK